MPLPRSLCCKRRVLVQLALFNPAVLVVTCGRDAIFLCEDGWVTTYQPSVIRLQYLCTNPLGPSTAVCHTGRSDCPDGQ
ncbi:hypothetical protein BaRGS_00007629 [Batillaria attramentaria]|uniref:Secreted protein n=1 Tax=Batillaria attramentaria TaxID=370345 RepID=A0ABD0LQ62_9CAEN